MASELSNLSPTSHRRDQQLAFCFGTVGSIHFQEIGRIVIVPGLLERFDLVNSEISVLRSVEIKVRWISLTAPDPIVSSKHRSPGLVILQIGSNRALVRTGSWRGCQRYMAKMMNVLIIDHVLLRQRPECVNELWLSPGFVDCGD